MTKRETAIRKHAGNLLAECTIDDIAVMLEGPYSPSTALWAARGLCQALQALATGYAPTAEFDDPEEEAEFQRELGYAYRRAGELEVARRGAAFRKRRG